MNKLLIAAAVAGLASVAIAPSVFAQNQSLPTQPSQTKMSETSQQQLATSFADSDVDKSGDISLKEANTVHPSLTEEQFKMVDKDKNGSLNEEEYVALDAAPRIGQEAN